MTLAVAIPCGEHDPAIIPDVGALRVARVSRGLARFAGDPRTGTVYVRGRFREQNRDPRQRPPIRPLSDSPARRAQDPGGQAFRLRAHGRQVAHRFRDPLRVFRSVREDRAPIRGRRQQEARAFRRGGFRPDSQVAQEEKQREGHAIVTHRVRVLDQLVLRQPQRRWGNTARAGLAWLLFVPHPSDKVACGVRASWVKLACTVRVAPPSWTVPAYPPDTSSRPGPLR